MMENKRYRVLLYTTGLTFDLPVFLEDYGEQMGVMVGFDGNVAQVEETSNFTYSGNSYSLTVYNTVNTNKLSFLVDSVFTIFWGDGSSSVLPMTGINDQNISHTSHTYTSSGEKTIRVTIESPWTVTELQKTVVIPFVSSFGFPTDLGTLTFTVPYSDPSLTTEQTYLQDYTTLTGSTPETVIGFQAVGKSRVDEFKFYGMGNTYSGITIVSGYTGYTIDGLTYIDTPDGSTIITGNTAQYYDDEVYNGMITRNEHFIGFVVEPDIFSDVFVERGQQGVMEKNLRLGEIDNMGELEIYGNGYFNVRKQ
jgi:hypothetical protein